MQAKSIQLLNNVEYITATAFTFITRVMNNAILKSSKSCQKISFFPSTSGCNSLDLKDKGVIKILRKIIPIQTNWQLQTNQVKVKKAAAAERLLNTGKEVVQILLIQQQQLLSHHHHGHHHHRRRRHHFRTLAYFFSKAIPKLFPLRYARHKSHHFSPHFSRVLQIHIYFRKHVILTLAIRRLTIATKRF